MKKSRFTEEQMVAILREAGAAPVPEVAKRHKVSEQTIYPWRKRFGTLEPADVVNGSLKLIHISISRKSNFDTPPCKGMA